MNSGFSSSTAVRIEITLMPVNIILQKKLMFIFHIANIPEQSLAREVFELQDRNELPCLVLQRTSNCIKLPTE